MTLKNQICDLKSCFLCRNSLPDWIAAISHNKKNIILKKGQTLFTEGDAVQGIYFVYDGVIKVHKNWNKDKEIILRFATKGDIVGHLGLGDGSAYPVSATAVEQTVVCFIDMPFFESSLNINGSLVKQLMRFFANELYQAEEKAKNLVHMPVKARIAQALLRLDEQFSTDAEGYLGIELSRQNLAAFSGTIYETLFRVVNDFTAEGIIKTNGRSMKISNKAALQQIIALENN